MMNLIGNKSYAQSYENTLDQKANFLSEILLKIKGKRKVSFLYQLETIDTIHISTEFSLDEDVVSILSKILPPVGLEFVQIGDQNYVIKKSKEYYDILDDQSIKHDSQSKAVEPVTVKNTKMISGLVRSEENEALIGVTVRVKDSDIGTITDYKGFYQMEIPVYENDLVFSYIGFLDKEISSIQNGDQLIYLREAENTLDEVIITAVGIEANKRHLGYAADHIEMDEISTAGESNIVNLLSGKSAGVWVNSSSGMPGASTNISIRGLRSINGSNKPLFVIDGIPVDNSTFGNGTGGVDVSNRLIDINQYDIDNLTILKGPLASVLYGIRAANGAIIMTSKSGKLGAPKISYSSSFGMCSYNKLPARQDEYSQGKFMDGEASYMGPETNVNSSFGPHISELEFDGATDYPYDNNGRLVASGSGNGVLAKSYDPYNAFFVKGSTINNHLAISGGVNKVQYYLSFGHFLENGIVSHSSFERYSVKADIDLQLHAKFALKISSNLVHSKGFRMKRGSLFSGVTLGLYRNPVSFDIGNGKKGNEAADFSEAYILENGKQRSFRANGSYDNPFWSVNRNPFEDKVNRILQGIQVSYNPLSWLKTKYKIGLDHYSDRRTSAYDINSGSFRKGRINLLDIESNNLNSDFLVFTENQLNDNWALKTTLGHNYYYSQYNIDRTVGNEFKKEGIYNLSNTITISKEEEILKKQLAGFFADLQIRYKNILYLNFSARNDWSSTLPKNNNRFLYPGCNIALEFTELLGLSDNRFLSYGKLRFSVAKVGNDANSYLTETYFRPTVINGDDLLPSTVFPAFGVSAFERSGVFGNPSLRPESTLAYEFGTDLKLLNGRIQLDMSLYKTINKDQIVNAQVSATAGFLSFPTNTGVIENQGIEFSMKAVPVRTKTFKWESAINFSKTRSLVSDLNDNNTGIVLASFTNISSMILEGQPYGVFMGSSVKRDQYGQQIIGEDGFPKINEIQTIIGDPTPDWLMAMNNQFTFKKFSISGSIEVRKGGDVWNGTKAVLDYLGVSEESGAQRKVRDFVFPGVTESGLVNTKAVDLANPENGMSGIYWRRYGFLGLAENNIEDGSWIRVRNVSVSYLFTPKWFTHEGSAFTVSLQGYNVFLYTKYKGVDPETNLRGDSNIVGWDYFTLPSTRGWSFSLKAQF